MTKTLLAAFRFPRRLALASDDPFAAQELVDFLKIDPSYFHQSFRKKYKPKPAFPDPGDRLTDEPGRGQTLDIVSKSRDARELLAATAALADFHRLVLREEGERWEAIEPDFPAWRRFPGGYVLWTARILEDLQGDGEVRPSRLRIVRQPVTNAVACDAVAKALGLRPEVAVEGEDMIVSYIARRKQRPALTVER